MNIPPPPPPIIDDRMFMLRLDDSIIRSVRQIKALDAARNSKTWPTGGTMGQWKIILRYLLDHRRAVMTGRVPPLRNRQMKVIGRMFVDGWDPEDIDGPWAADTLDYYVMHDQITFDAEHYARHTTPEAQAAIAEAPTLFDLEDPDYGWFPNIPVEPRMREMPHRPHRRSLMMPRDAALAFVARATAARATAMERKDRDFLRTFASQHLILAFTDH